MAVIKSGNIDRAALSLALAAGLLAGLASSPARAGDDGSAPIWVGFGSVLGIVKKDSDDQIDYREHGKLVVPPKMTLPPPGVKAAQANGAWPIDPDVVRAKKAKEEAKKSAAFPVGRYEAPLIKPGAVVTVTTTATAGQGPGGGACIKEGVPVACPEKTGPSWNFNPLTWVGLEKKPGNKLGPEPEREWLTDPPPGYRAPVEGVGAVADN